MALALTIIATSAKAQQPPGGGGGGGSSGPATDRFFGGLSSFFFFDQSQQGGADLPGGQTAFTFVNLQYNMPRYFSGAGVVYQRDRRGAAQVGTHIGLKYELYWDEYYAEVVYSQITQKYQDRSISRRDGYETLLGAGRRVPILKGLVYFDLSLKRRMAEYVKQDGRSLAISVSTTEMMPFLGLGTTL